MGRQQCKNIFDNIESNMAIPKTSGSTTAKLGHPNADETEEYHLKNNFMEMIEALKEEMKNSLKEMEERTNKKLQEINKSLKEIKENQEKTIKKVKETFQDLKIK